MTSNSFDIKAYLSIDKVTIPSEAGHDSGDSIGVGQHVPHGHLVEPGVPEGDDGGSARSMASLVVMVIHENQSVSIGHESPALAPVPEHKNSG